MLHNTKRAFALVRASREFCQLTGPKRTKSGKFCREHWGTVIWARIGPDAENSGGFGPRGPSWQDSREHGQRRGTAVDTRLRRVEGGGNMCFRRVTAWAATLGKSIRRGVARWREPEWHRGAAGVLPGSHWPPSALVGAFFCLAAWLYRVLLSPTQEDRI